MTTRTITRLLRLSPLALALGLGACSEHLNGEIDDVYSPPLHYQRYPIEVVKGSARIEVPNRSGLTQAEKSSVARFAQQARGASAMRVAVQYPSGGSAQANRVAEILEQQGVPAGAIAMSQYGGGKGAPVVASFSRTVAQTAECGDWTANVARTEDNLPMPNFGCAHQQNIAAVIANPNDVLAPRAETPPDAARRQQVITDYRTPKSPATPVDSQQEVNISDVAQQ
jgi:pilus assembly protein CpaD